MLYHAWIWARRRPIYNIISIYKFHEIRKKSYYLIGNNVSNNYSLSIAWIWKLLIGGRKEEGMKGDQMNIAEKPYKIKIVEAMPTINERVVNENKK